MLQEMRNMIGARFAEGLVAEVLEYHSVDYHYQFRASTVVERSTPSPHTDSCDAGGQQSADDGGQKHERTCQVVQRQTTHSAGLQLGPR